MSFNAQEFIKSQDAKAGSVNSAPSASSAPFNPSAFVAAQDRLYTNPEKVDTAKQAIQNSGGQGLKGTLQRALIGTGHGMMDVVNTGENALLHAGHFVGLVPESAIQAHDQRVADNNRLFNQLTAVSPAAQIGDVGGQIAATAPFMMAGGGALNAAARGAGALVPAIARPLELTSNFLTGGAGATGTGIKGLATRAASRVAAGTGVGASAAGLTSSQSDTPVLNQIGQGAAFGALGGAVIPAAGAVAKLGTRTVRNGIDYMMGNTAKKAGKRAANELMKAFEKDGISPQQAVNQLTKYGEAATPADVGGANVASLVDRVSTTPGQGANIAQSVLEGRAQEAPTRVAQAIKNASGVSGNVYGDAERLMAQRSQEAAPLYEKAFSAPVQVTPHLEQMLQNPNMSKGVKIVANAARNEADATGSAFNPEHFNMEGQPSMRALDAGKRGLDALIEKYRDPVTGKLNLDTVGRSLNKLRSSYVSALDQANPEYAAARKAWAGPSQALDAMDMGRRALSKDKEVTQAMVNNFSPSEKEFFLSGVTRALQDKIEKAQDGADVTRKIFGNTAIRDKIKAALGNDKAYNEFKNSMEAEARFAQTRNAALKGSKSAKVLAAQGASPVDLSEPAWHLMHGNIPGAGLSLANRLTANMGPSEAQNAALASYLFGGVHGLNAAATAAQRSRLAQTASDILGASGRIAPGEAALLLQANQGR